MSKRVLLSFPLRIGVPGVGMTAWHQATGLARRGAEVHVACGSVERDMPGVHVLSETMAVAGRKLPYRAIGTQRATALHDRRIARLLLRDRHRFDVVHAWPGCSERTLAAARARAVPAFLERPNAHTAFGFDVVSRECARLGLNLTASNPHAFDEAKLEREEREFAACDALLCPSDFVAATHAERGEPQARLLRHRYGYDPSQFAPSGRLRGRSPLRVSFLGRLEPRKGVHLALDAWSRSDLGQRAYFVLCGQMEPGYQAVLAPMLDQPTVELRGHVPNPASLLQESDVLVLPSLEEGSALVTYEARACGATLLVSDRTGAPVQHEHNGLVHAAGDVETLTQHLARLVQDPKLLPRLRANSLARIDQLTWDAAADALLTAYAEGTERVRAALTARPRLAGVRAVVSSHKRPPTHVRTDCSLAEGLSWT